MNQFDTYKWEFSEPPQDLSLWWFLYQFKWRVHYGVFCLCRAENEKSLSSDPSSTDVKSFFSNCNVAALRQLGGGRVLLDLCLSLPEFSKIASKPESSATLISLTSSRCVLNLQHSKLQTIWFAWGIQKNFRLLHI